MSAEMETLAAERRLEILAYAVRTILPIGDPLKPDSAVFPIYVRMSELRALHSLAARTRPTTTWESGL